MGEAKDYKACLWDPPHLHHQPTTPVTSQTQLTEQENCVTNNGSLKKILIRTFDKHVICNFLCVRQYDKHSGIVLIWTRDQTKCSERILFSLDLKLHIIVLYIDISDLQDCMAISGLQEYLVNRNVLFRGVHSLQECPI